MSTINQQHKDIYHNQQKVNDFKVCSCFFYLTNYAIKTVSTMEYVKLIFGHKLVNNHDDIFLNFYNGWFIVCFKKFVKWAAAMKIVISILNVLNHV